MQSKKRRGGRCCYSSELNGHNQAFFFQLRPVTLRARFDGCATLFSRRLCTPFTTHACTGPARLPSTLRAVTIVLVLHCCSGCSPWELA